MGLCKLPFIVVLGERKKLFLIFSGSIFYHRSEESEAWALALFMCLYGSLSSLPTISTFLLKFLDLVDKNLDISITFSF